MMDLYGYLQNLSLKVKLILAMTIAGLIPILMTGIINTTSTAQALNDTAKNQLNSIKVNKKSHIESYFNQLRDQVITLSESEMTINAMREFSQNFNTLPAQIPVTTAVKKQALSNYYTEQYLAQYNKNNPSNLLTNVDDLIPNTEAALTAQYLYIAKNKHPLGSKDNMMTGTEIASYHQTHAKYHEKFQNYLSRFSYYDIFLIEPINGDIVYSVFKEIDYGTSLKHGPHQDSNLASAYVQALDLANNKAKLIDFSPYSPSYDTAASFIASPIYDQQQLIGVLVFQMPVASINHIMQISQGLGNSGEIYLIGSDNLMRSQSIFTTNNSILSTEVKTKATQEIFNNQSGSAIINDYRAIEVLSSYSPLDITDLEWGIIAEIHKSEALSAIDTLIYETLLVALLTLIVLVFFSIVFAKTLSKPLEKAIAVAKSIAQGKLDNTITVRSNNEVGELLLALKEMQSNINLRIEATHRELAINTRIKQALDTVSANVMVLDKSHRVVYSNHAFNQLIEQYNGVFNLTHSSLNNASCSKVFSALNIHHSQLLGFSKEHQLEVTINGITLTLIANPVLTKDQQNIGTVIEFYDRTLEVETQIEIKEVIDNALIGDFDTRIEMTNKVGFFKTFAHSINQLVEVSAQVADDTLRIFGALAKGDLTQQITTEYQGQFQQLKNDANSTIVQLTSTVTKIKDSAINVNHEAHQLSSGNENLHQRTVEQSESLDKNNMALSQITTSVNNNYASASQAHKLMKKARIDAEQGGDVVNNAINAMDTISHSTSNISEIISLIDNIAFQTNLLALNAAVEAARAGEQGRGFAVVAGEVRDLAGRSAAAAKDINLLISDAQTKVNDGSILVKETGKTLKNIIGSVNDVSGVVENIAKASETQASSMKKINQTTKHLETITIQNSALVSMAANSSKNLTNNAQELEQLITFFSVSDKQPAKEAPLTTANRIVKTL